MAAQAVPRRVWGWHGFAPPRPAAPNPHPASAAPRCAGGGRGVERVRAQGAGGEGGEGQRAAVLQPQAQRRGGPGLHTRLLPHAGRREVERHAVGGCGGVGVGVEVEGESWVPWFAGGPAQQQAVGCPAGACQQSPAQQSKPSTVGPAAAPAGSLVRHTVAATLRCLQVDPCGCLPARRRQGMQRRE